MKVITSRTSNAVFDTLAGNLDAGNPAEAGSRVGLAARVLLLLLRAYKLAVSPYYSGSCRFLPSCADYAREAVMRHGAARGSWLAARRLVRCHPFCAGGHDPVPNR